VEKVLHITSGTSRKKKQQQQQQQQYASTPIFSRSFENNIFAMNTTDSFVARN